MTLLEDAKLKDPTTSEEDRLQVRVNRLQRSLMTGSDTNLGPRVQMLEKEARLLMKDFPSHSELGGLLLAAATQWLELGDLEKARKLATEISESGGSSDVTEEALALVRKIGRIGKPLAIKFKAVDGREVDLAALKGKVVLVDFWATWCGPCVAGLPHLQETYAKFQAKGFEIVGISLDKEKPELLQAIADKKIPWPQHFQEGGEANKIADAFEVGPIPAMWIVDKKGNLRDFNGTENLAEKVERFLAE
jgi:thiol-disulfide isomerase/thioredoxin